MATLSLRALLHGKKLQAARRKGSVGAKNKAKAIRAVEISGVRKDVIGLTLKWIDTDPLGDGREDESSLEVCSVNHDAHIRSLAVSNWDNLDMRTWIVTSVFTWVAVVKVVFELPNNKNNSHKIDEFEFRVTDHLRHPQKGDDTKLNNEIINKIMASRLGNTFYGDDDKNMGVFVRAEYEVVCVGV